MVDSKHPGLRHTAASPFEAVPKMLPNRALSSEVRLVHDQRGINGGTSKDLHPPAVQPTHQQVVRRILFWKGRYPKIPIVLAKKDVAGAFRLLWLDPKDVELFAGEVPWKVEAMGSGEGEQEKGDPGSMTMLFLVSSFGFSGSPGEWNIWGRATEEVHRCYKPAKERRDGALHFDGKILVDDMVLVEPCVGLRPWGVKRGVRGGGDQTLGSRRHQRGQGCREGLLCSGADGLGSHHQRPNGTDVVARGQNTQGCLLACGACLQLWRAQPDSEGAATVPRHCQWMDDNCGGPQERAQGGRPVPGWN